MKIAVLGATGTVGQALLPLLARQHEVLAVSRRPREETSGVRWAVADASDAESLKRVFDQVDIAYYLVHSLGSRDFEQRDRVAAANVARHLSKPACASSCTSTVSVTSHTIFTVENRSSIGMARDRRRHR
jgi:uncharacterized protein YbjT (DUF2867 family)